MRRCRSVRQLSSWRSRHGADVRAGVRLTVERTRGRIETRSTYFATRLRNGDDAAAAGETMRLTRIARRIDAATRRPPRSMEPKLFW